MSSPQTNGDRRVSAWEVAAFAAPAGPLLALTLPTVMFLPPHFIAHVGLDAWLVGAMFFAARLFDLLLDPAMGSLQDRTETRWGRRRIWLACAAPFLMAAIYVVFIGLKPGASPAAAGAAIFAMYFVFATMMVAHLAWSGELIPSYHGRTRTLGAVQAASLIGQTAMLVIAGVVRAMPGGSDALAVQAMGWTLIVMLPVTVALACFGAREREIPPQAHLPLGEAISTVLANPVARRVLLPDLLLGVAQGVSGGLFLFYFQFVLGFETQAQTLAAIYFVAGLIGVPVWWWLGQRIAKHRALMAAFIYTAVTLLMVTATPRGDFAFAAGFMVLAGLAQGGCILLTRSLMGDVVDDDEVRTSTRRSGLYFGLLLMTSKAGLAVGPLALAALGLFGFDAERGAANPPQALAALSAMFIAAPAILCVLGAISLLRYPLDEGRQAELAAAIAARHAPEHGT